MLYDFVQPCMDKIYAIDRFPEVYGGEWSAHLDPPSPSRSKQLYPETLDY